MGKTAKPPLTQSEQYLKGPCSKVAVSSDSEWVVGADGNAADVWSIRTGKRLCRIRLPTIRRHPSRIERISFGPSALALSVYHDPHYEDIHVYGTNGRELWRAQVGGTEAPGIAFSPDGATLAVAGGGYGVLLFSTASGKVTRRFKTNHTGSPLFLARCVAFSPDGAKLAVASSDGVVLLDRATGKVIREVRRKLDYDLKIAFMTDGRRAIVAGDKKGYAVFDLGAGRLVVHRRWSAPLSFGEPLDDVAFGQDAIFISDKRDVIRRFDPVTGKEKRDVMFPFRNYGFFGVSPDGTMLATGASMGVRLWDTRSGEELLRPRPDRSR